MKERISFVESAMKDRQIVFLSIVLLVGLGVFALFKMPRQEFPVFTIRQGLVIGAYPGATSAQVEEQLTTQVERYLYSYKEIDKKKTYSVSKDGVMIIFVELTGNVKNSDEFWSKLKHGLNSFKAQLPLGVLALYADNDFGDTSALLISIESDNKSYRELEGYLNSLEDRLRQIPSVSKLRHYGLQKEQITIYLEKNKLEKYGIRSSVLSATLFAHGLTAAGGSIDNGSIEATIHVSDVYNTEKDIAGQIIYSDPAGNIIRLKDVARVVREYSDPDSYILNNSRKCLLISMEMLEGNNIVEYGEEIDKVLHNFQEELPDGVTIKRIADQPKVVGNSVRTFLFELMFAILSVILVTMLLLPFRVASVAASSIPITIFMSLGLMYVFGLELNTVTLAALIVVLGMIVDNSVVIVDSYMGKLDEGMERWPAAISSARAYFKAIFSATLAISITFFPFLFTLTGTFNDFVRMFPWTVTLTLGISLLVAMLVIPYMQYYFVKRGFKKPESGKKKKFNMLTFIQNTYEKYLYKAFARPKMTIGFGVFSVLLAVFLFTRMPLRLFPVAERDQFAIEIYLPQGSSLQRTAMVADSLEHMLDKDDRITSITSFIGTSSPRFHTTYAPSVPAKNYAQFIVNTSSSRNTEVLLTEYSKIYSDYFPNAYVRFKQLDYQPVAAPVEVRLTGNNITMLKYISDSLVKKIRVIKGVTWVRTDFGEMQPSARIDINSVEANRLGIDKTTVSTNLAVRFSELPITTIWEKDYPVSVKLKTMTNGKESFEDINSEYIHSFIPTVSVPLRQIATVIPDWNQGQIVRRNGVPTLTVRADIGKGENINKIFSEVKAVAEQYNMPKGTTLSYGGAHEMDIETFPELLSGLIISILIIFMILLIHFRKINLAVLVLASSTLSFLGGLIGLFLFRMEFGITAVLGVVSLIGILVRNGIIMLDYAEDLRINHNRTVKEAAIEAGKRRMRPIFLTSAAASVGVIPMIVSSNPLWSPMGTVICFGTITAMILLVLILPVAYWMSFERIDRKRAKQSSGNSTEIIPRATMTIILLLSAGLYSSYSQTGYSLEQCKKLAMENNNQVKNSNLELLASKQTKKSAFTNYFPKISGTAMAYRFNDPLLNIDMPGGNLPVYDGNPANLLTPTQFAYFPGVSMSMIDKGYIGALTAIQPVFTGGRIVAGNNLAKVSVDASASKLVLSESEVQLKTEENYWLIVSLNEKLKTLSMVEQLLDTIYNEANDACNAGLINKNDVLKVTLKQSEARITRMKLEHGIRLATMSFCQHLGIPFDESMVLTDTIGIEKSPVEVYVDVNQALQNREEYKLLEHSVKAEELKSRLKIGEYLPQVGVGVGALYYDIQDAGTFNSMLFASVSIPISGWWDASHSMKARKYQEEIARNTQKNNSELLLLQIQKTWNELDESYKQIEVVRETIAQAEESMKINRDNYKAGIVNISDMLEAQALLQQTKNNLTDALSAYKVKFVNYLQVTGRYK